MIKKTTIVLLLTGLMFLLGSWGFLVHRTLHQLAVYELPDAMQPFFHMHMEYLVNNATRPDMRRNSDSTEAAKHFIDLEMYGEQAATGMPLGWQAAVKKYHKDSLLKYGYVPYYVVHMKERLTAAYRQKNKDSILFYAADLGHYVADANVPLHATVNYDGQLTNQKGLHSLWESMIPELEMNGYNLYSAHKAAYLKNPAAAIWEAVRRSARLVPGMLQKEKEVSKGFTAAQKFRLQVRKGREYKSYTTEFARAYAAALGTSVNDQLRHSADLIADFWYTSWVDAGKPDLGSITAGWTADRQAKLEMEQKAFRANQLISQQLLFSRKGSVRETE